jgi:hypothetical protein
MAAHSDDNEDDIDGGDITPGYTTENSQDNEQLSDDFICDDHIDFFTSFHRGDITDESQTELDDDEDNMIPIMPEEHYISEDNSDTIQSIPMRRSVSVIASDTDDDSIGILRVSPRKRANSCISTDSDSEENNTNLTLSPNRYGNAVSGYMDMEAEEGLCF